MDTGVWKRSIKWGVVGFGGEMLAERSILVSLFGQVSGSWSSIIMMACVKQWFEAS